MAADELFYEKKLIFIIRSDIIFNSYKFYLRICSGVAAQSNPRRVSIMKNRILIVEDSKSFSSIIMNRLTEESVFEPVLARTYGEADELLKKSDDFFLAILDLHLPDSENGEIVDLAKSHGIPVIVMTSYISDEIQEMIWAKNIVDYVIKEGPHTLDYIHKLITRISRNGQIKIIIVDDSRTARVYMRALLEVHKYQVYEAATGAEALNILRENEDIKLALIDYNMPEMDGVELTRKIRSHFPMDSLGIIGLSSYGNHKLSVNFIKHGANDFITKPFLSEQLYCRVTQNIEIIDHFDMIREMSNTDYLTRVYNRRYFFNVGEILFNNAKRSGNSIALAMIDIDRFKSINDTYGHESGDVVLVHLAEVLKESFRKSDIVARYGGEEFCVIACNIGNDDLHAMFDSLRRKIEQTAIPHPGGELSVTVSIGISNGTRETLNDMVIEADKKLYEVKKAGRNRVAI